jgi:hypothetical protein
MLQVEVARAQFDEFAPAQPGLDIGLHQQPQLARGQRLADSGELVGRDDPPRRRRHRRCLDPAHGFRVMIWSLNAVVKIADNTARQCLTVAGFTPASKDATDARMSAGRIAIIL